MPRGPVFEEEASKWILRDVGLVREARPFRVRSWRGIARRWWRIVRDNNNEIQIVVYVLALTVAFMAGRNR